MSQNNQKLKCITLAFHGPEFGNGRPGLPMVLFRSSLVLEPYSILLCDLAFHNANITGFPTWFEVGLENHRAGDLCCSSEKVSCSSLIRLVLIVDSYLLITLVWPIWPLFWLSLFFSHPRCRLLLGWYHNTCNTWQFPSHICPSGLTPCSAE